MTPKPVARQIATDGLLKRGETRATPRKNNPRSAIAKNIRGPVIIEPFKPLNADTITTALMMAAPNPPNSGICSAAVAAINFDCAICGSGNRYMNPMFTTRYTNITQSVPRISASGSVRWGFLTSPPMNDRSAQPSYVHMTEISAVANSDRCRPEPQAGVKCEAPPELAVKASAPNAITATYLATVANVMTAAARRTPM